MTTIRSCQYLGPRMSHVQYATLGNNVKVVVAAAATTTTIGWCNHISIIESNSPTVAVIMEKQPKITV